MQFGEYPLERKVPEKGAGPSGTFPPKSFPEGPTQAGVRRPALWDRVTSHSWRPELLVPTLHPIQGVSTCPEWL